MRREGDDRLTRQVDDMITVFTFLDERKLLDEVTEVTDEFHSHGSVHVCQADNSSSNSVSILLTSCHATLAYSVLGPLLFTAYVAPVSELIDSFDVSHRHFADDLHLFVAMEAGDNTSDLERLTRCSDAVRRWFLLNHLQLNVDKSRHDDARHCHPAEISRRCNHRGRRRQSSTCQARDEVARRHHRQPLNASTSTPQPSPRRVTITYRLCATRGIC